jgi:hypothetical protein
MKREWRKQSTPVLGTTATLSVPKSQCRNLGKFGQLSADLAAALDPLGEIDDRQNDQDDEEQSDETARG